MTFKDTNWTRGELGHTKPSREEARREIKKMLEEEDKTIQELKEEKKELEKQIRENRIREDEREKTVEKAVEMVEEEFDKYCDSETVEGDQIGFLKHRIKEGLDSVKPRKDKPGKSAIRLSKIEAMLEVLPAYPETDYSGKQFYYLTRKVNDGTDKVHLTPNKDETMCGKEVLVSNPDEPKDKWETIVEYRETPCTECKEKAEERRE